VFYVAKLLRVTDPRSAPTAAGGRPGLAPGGGPGIPLEQIAKFAGGLLELVLLIHG